MEYYPSYFHFAIQIRKDDNRLMVTIGCWSMQVKLLVDDLPHLALPVCPMVPISL